MPESNDLQGARRKLTDLLTQTLVASAEAAALEQEELKKKFPAMSGVAIAKINPEKVRDFTQSDIYQQAIKEYVQGRIELSGLTQVLDTLRTILPWIISAL